MISRREPTLRRRRRSNSRSPTARPTSPRTWRRTSSPGRRRLPSPQYRRRLLQRPEYDLPYDAGCWDRKAANCARLPNDTILKAGRLAAEHFAAKGVEPYRSFLNKRCSALDESGSAGRDDAMASGPESSSRGRSASNVAELDAGRNVDDECGEYGLNDTDGRLSKKRVRPYWRERKRVRERPYWRVRPSGHKDGMNKFEPIGCRSRLSRDSIPSSPQRGYGCTVTVGDDKMINQAKLPHLTSTEDSWMEINSEKGIQMDEHALQGRESCERSVSDYQGIGCDEASGCLPPKKLQKSDGTMAMIGQSSNAEINFFSVGSCDEDDQGSLSNSVEETESFCEHGTNSSDIVTFLPNMEEIHELPSSVCMSSVDTEIIDITQQDQVFYTREGKLETPYLKFDVAQRNEDPLMDHAPESSEIDKNSNSCSDKIQTQPSAVLRNFDLNITDSSEVPEQLLGGFCNFLSVTGRKDLQLNVNTSCSTKTGGSMSQEILYVNGDSDEDCYTYDISKLESEASNTCLDNGVEHSKNLEMLDLNNPFDADHHYSRNPPVLNPSLGNITAKFGAFPAQII